MPDQWQGLQAYAVGSIKDGQKSLTEVLHYLIIAKYLFLFNWNNVLYGERQKSEIKRT